VCRLLGKNTTLNIDLNPDLKLRFTFKRLHVRRGLKIIQEAKAIDLEAYMLYVEDFYDKYMLKNPDKIGKVRKNVYLVTEDLGVLDEALKKF